ncbi:MAG TPA: hypothetical protein VF814_17490 [Casimicrobiaceae bacterium]
MVLLLTWRHAARTRLIKEDTTLEVVDAICRRITIAQTLYALGAALSLINTYWSIGFIVLVQLNYAVAPPWRLSRRRG